MFFLGWAPDQMTSPERISLQVSGWPRSMRGSGETTDQRVCHRLQQCLNIIIFIYIIYSLFCACVYECVRLMCVWACACVCAYLQVWVWYSSTRSTFRQWHHILMLVTFTVAFIVERSIMNYPMHGQLTYTFGSRVKYLNILGLPTGSEQHLYSWGYGWRGIVRRRRLVGRWTWSCRSAVVRCG
jgi:hypothetical protein